MRFKSMSAVMWIVGCLLLLVSGCSSGTAPTVTASTPPSSRDLSGNWEFDSATPAAGLLTGDGNVTLSGALQGGGSQVSGVMQVSGFALSSACLNLLQIVSMSGTVDATGTLNLTSAAISGVVVKASTPLPAAAGQQATGTVEVDGGNCTARAESAVVAELAPVNGTYTGTETMAANSVSSPPGTGTATLTLAQSATPYGPGFPLTGTLTFVSTNCMVTYPVSGGVTGINESLSSLGSSSAYFSVATSGAVSADATRFSPFSLRFPSGVCTAAPNPSGYTGALTRQ